MRDFHQPGRSAAFASNGLCATSHPLAARTAIDILARGGNAMDAAIAGAVLLGFCEPQMTGIGGDCFVLFTDPGAIGVKALNGSGRAPAAASAEALREGGHNTVPLYSIRLDQGEFYDHSRSALTSAFAISISFLMSAVRATLAGFPAAIMAWYFLVRSGLWRAATRAGM